MVLHGSLGGSRCGNNGHKDSAEPPIGIGRGEAILLKIWSLRAPRQWDRPLGDIARMRLRHHIKDHNKPEFTAALDKLRIRYKSTSIGGTGQVVASDCFDLFVYDDDPKWPMLRDLAAELGVRVWHSPVFSSDDVASAPWLLAHATADLGYPQPENDFGYLSATFDTSNCCERCCIGKVQVRPFRLCAEPKSKRAHFFAPQWEHQVLFARHEVREVFEAEGVSGPQYLVPVKHRTGAPLESIVQILPTTTLQGGLIAAVQEQVTCSPDDKEMRSVVTITERRGMGSYSFCGRTKYHVPSRLRLIHYSRAAFVRAPDIVLSAEWYGSGGAASQQVIVSNKVARLVLANKWNGLELEPIELV